MELEPVHPKWITFFDGEQFQQYQNFVKTRDFNKILVNQPDFQGDKSIVQDLKTWPPEEMTSHPVGGWITNPEAEYSEIPDEKPLPPDIIYSKAEEAKARRKRTRTYVLLGILMLSLLAMLIALLFHFYLQKSLFGTTERGESVTVAPPPYYGSFAPEENKLTSQTTLRSSANANNHNHTRKSYYPLFANRQYVDTTCARYESSGPVLLKSLTNPSKVMIEGLSGLLFDPAKIEHDVIEVTTPATQGQVTASNLVAKLTEKLVNLECLLAGIEDWQSISVVKLTDNPKEDLIVAKMMSLSRGEVTASNPRVKARFFRTGNDIKLIVQLEPPECNDNGWYRCQATISSGVVLSTRFRVSLISPVEVPVLHVPYELIEDKPTRMKTTWNAGYPEFQGILVWEIFNKTAGEYDLLDYSDYVATISKSNCTTVIETTFLVTPLLSWNGTQIRTKVISTLSSAAISAKNLTSSPYHILVVPANICVDIRNGTFIAHPYTCHKFIRCTDNDIHAFVCPNDLCFDLDPETCVKETDA